MSETDHAAEVLIRVENVGKIFCRDLKKSLFYGVTDSLREMLPWLKPRQFTGQDPTRLRPGEFWANNDISFQVRRGECYGLIGRNGAGKTTLLKMLNGLIKPDKGSIEIRGRVGGLIALGAGFNPILTGRENIYINGSVLGLTKSEIDRKMEDIINFAEIRDFIDTPVQSYSSGMQVRLGFAIATALEPDILILDEVLAVGDAPFRIKCYKRIADLQARCAIIFVSHSETQLATLCTHGIVLQKGVSKYIGTVRDAINAYNAITDQSDIARGVISCSSDITKSDLDLSVDEEAKTISITLSIHCLKPIEDPLMRLVFEKDGQPICEWNSANAGSAIHISGGDSSIRLSIPSTVFAPGSYSFYIQIHGKNRYDVVFWMRSPVMFNQGGNLLCWNPLQLPGTAVMN